MASNKIGRFAPIIGPAFATSVLRGLPIASLVVSLMLAAGPASAQSAVPEDAPAAGAGTAMSPSALTPAQQANRDRIKGERETCRAQAQHDGAKGPAMRTAVQDCMAKVDPVAAKRMKCVQAAKAQSLSGDALRKSVRTCMTGA